MDGFFVAKFAKFIENTPLHRGRNVVTAWFEKKHYDASWSDLLMSSSFAHVNVVPYTYKVSTSQFHTYFSFIASLCTVEIWYFMYLQHTPMYCNFYERWAYSKQSKSKIRSHKSFFRQGLLRSPTFSRHT